MAINTSTRLDQVKSHLLDYINVNKLAQGERLPSEAEMAKSLGVSRNTIREAYITLESEEVIVRRHGVGTFVSETPKIKEPILDQLFGFPQLVKAAGYQFDFKLCSVKHVIPTDEVNLALKQDLGSSVLQVKRIMYANEIPGSFIIDYFSTHVDETKFDWQSFDGNMIEFISSSLEIDERRIHTIIRADLANDEVASNLSLPQGTPLVNVCSTVFQMDESPLTYSVIYLHPDSFELEVSRTYKPQ